MAVNTSDQQAIMANILDTQLGLEDLKQNMDTMFLVFNGIIVTCEYYYIRACTYTYINRISSIYFSFIYTIL